jgi:hypothetical protein
MFVAVGVWTDANMAGANFGVKMKISAINPRTFSTMCGCHSWNLLLGDTDKSSTTAILFFNLNRVIYTLFIDLRNVSNSERETANNFEAFFRNTVGMQTG